MTFTVVAVDMFTDKELGRFTAETKDAAWDAAWAEFGWNDPDWLGDVRFEERTENDSQ